jgi:hypothetical protein
MLTVTITELNVRAAEHVRNVNDADRYGWLREDARRAGVDVPRRTRRPRRAGL